MIKNKLLIKNSFLLFLKLVITSVIGIASTRILLDNLGVSDFGLYNVVGGIVIMMGFLNTVMCTTTFRFIAFEMGRKDEGAINNVFNISFLIHLGIGALVVLIAESVGIWYLDNHLNVDFDQISRAKLVFRFSTMAVVFNIISIPFQGLLTALEKFSVIISIEISKSIVNLAFIILLIYALGDKLEIYAMLMSFLAFSSSFSYILYSKNKFKLFTKWKVSKDKFKYIEMLSFSGWVMFGAAASVGQRQGAILLINSFFGTLLNASFAIATQINSFVTMFANNIGQAAIPQITKSYSGGEDKRVLHLVTYIGKYSFFLMLLVAVPILLETEYLLKLWIFNLPRHTIIFTQLIILNGLFDCLRSGTPAVIQSTGKIKWFQIIMGSVQLMSIPISYLLFKLDFSPFYILVVFILSSVVNTIVGLILLRKILHFNVKFLIKESYLRIGYVLIFIMPLFVGITYFEQSMIRLFSSLVISTVWLFIIVYIFGLDYQERHYILGTIKKFLSNKSN